MLSSSPQKQNNSRLLAEEFVRGAQDAGHQVEIAHLREKQIGFCQGCHACVKTGKSCVQNDDMSELIEKVQQLSLAWMMCKKPWIVPIPGSREENRLRENFGAGDVVLSGEEIAQIDALLDGMDLPVYGQRK